jgi:hypothetical protein
VIASRSPSRRPFAFLAGALVLVVAACSSVGAADPTAVASAAPSLASNLVTSASVADSALVTPAISISIAAMPAGPTFQPINVFASPTPGTTRAPSSTDGFFGNDTRRPTPVQQVEWLALKASGRVAIVGGRPGLLSVAANPLVAPGTGAALPAARALDTDWTRWIVEPWAYGSDAAGNSFSNLNYWNLCSAGATAATLWYWQQLVGFPDVSAMAIHAVEPYVEETGSWPSPGPSLPLDAAGARLGTYWAGSDTVNGFTANGRGYLMYLATQVQPVTWTTSGMVAYSSTSGDPLYPTRGAGSRQIMTVLNWELSGQDERDWIGAWYTSVSRADPQLARDLSVAVMLDVGRDGVPVVAAVDTYNLPNWQAGASTPHIRHAIAIVGYDNTANPPTYTYIDTCGSACNSRGGNRNGQLHVIPQSQMVAAIAESLGSGFVW